MYLKNYAVGHLWQPWANLFDHMSYNLNFSHFSWTPQRGHDKCSRTMFYLIWHPDNKEINITWQPIRSPICWSASQRLDRPTSGEGIILVRDTPQRWQVGERGGLEVKSEKKREREWSGQQHGNSGLFDWWRHAGSQAGRPGNAIQGGCLNMTSLGAIQSAAKPSSGASPGMVAGRLQLWAHCLSTPLHPLWRKRYDGKRRGEERRREERR